MKPLKVFNHRINILCFRKITLAAKRITGRGNTRLEAERTTQKQAEKSKKERIKVRKQTA
jgi:hypothetical protein